MLHGFTNTEDAPLGMESKKPLARNSGYEPEIGFLESDKATGNPLMKRAPAMNEVQSISGQPPGCANHQRDRSL